MGAEKSADIASQPISASGDGNREVASKGGRFVHRVTKHCHQAPPAAAARPAWELSDSSACTPRAAAFGYCISAGLSTGLSCSRPVWIGSACQRALGFARGL